MAPAARKAGRAVTANGAAGECRCGSCGYDLTGLDTQDEFVKCPECGWVSEPVGHVDDVTSFGRQIVTAVGVIFSGLAAAVAVVVMASFMRSRSPRPEHLIWMWAAIGVGLLAISTAVCMTQSGSSRAWRLTLAGLHVAIGAVCLLVLAAGVIRTGSGMGLRVLCAMLLMYDGIALVVLLVQGAHRRAHRRKD